MMCSSCIVASLSASVARPIFATCVFLRTNGLTITASPEATLAFVIGALEAGAFEKPLLEAWLRAHTEAV